MRHAFLEVQLLDSRPKPLTQNGPSTTDKSPCVESSLDRFGRYLRMIVLLQGPGNDRRRVSTPEQTLNVIAKPVDELVFHHDVVYELRDVRKWQRQMQSKAFLSPNDGRCPTSHLMRACW